MNIKGAAIGLSVLSLFIPFMNLCIYRRLRRVLSASPHHSGSPIPQLLMGRSTKSTSPACHLARRRSNRATWATRKAATCLTAILRQFFSQPGKVEKGQKPPLRYDARCIHESIRDYLNVYEAKRAKPWTQKGAICGFTKGS